MTASPSRSHGKAMPRNCCSRSRARGGLSFATAGVKLPLPVNLSVKDEPFRGLLQLLRAQIGYRAAVRQEGDRIVLAYNRPQQ